MKRILVGILGISLLISLTGCGNSSSTASTEGFETPDTGSIGVDIEAGTVETDSTLETSSSDSDDYTGFFECESTGEGISINEDGTFLFFHDFENEKGKIIGTYTQDGDQCVFTSPGFENGSETGTFDGGEWIINGDEYHSEFSTAMLNMITTPLQGVYVNGDIKNVLGTKVKDLADLGFSVDMDYENTTLEAGKTYNLESSCGNAKATLGVINTYANDAPVGECRVYSFETEDTSGTFQLDMDGNTCGEDNFDTLLNFHVYEYEPEKLVYNVYLLHSAGFSGSIIDEASEPYGEEVVDIPGESTLTMKFDGSILKSFRFEADSIANGGMNDNILSGEQENLDTVSIESSKLVRDDICSQLKSAFADSDIDLSINETTGEITMDNDILFDVDSYELSDEGKAYLDKMVGIYAQVLLSDEFKDQVEQIRFEGHTDSSGDFGYNQTLSQKRADTVMNYCLTSTENGLSDEQKEQLQAFAVAQGFSCTDLVYDEDGNEDADASRRVTLKFFVKVG